MANQCHLYHRGHQGAVGFLLSIVILVGCSNCAAYTIRNYRTNKAQLPGADGTSVESSPSDSQVDIDRFYFPTDEGLREFQQILLRELGLTKVPDLSKVNISRDEYDRQRQQMLFDDDDIALAQVEEYHQFSVIPTDDNELERRETVILNHGDVRAVRRHRPSGLAWKLRFRAPSSNNGSTWQSESSHPLELHWSPDPSPLRPSSSSVNKRNPFDSYRSTSTGGPWSLLLRVDHPNDGDLETVVIRPEDLDQSSSFESRTKPNLGSRLDAWLNQLSNIRNGQDDHVLAVSVVCQGRGCHSLRHWRLSAQLRLVVWSSDDRDRELQDVDDGSRVKRHITKKNNPSSSKKSSSGNSSMNNNHNKNSSTNNNNNNNNNNGNLKKRPAPQPKDILLGQQAKKGVGKSGGSDCSTSKKGKKCCPHSLKINFRQLPGFDWILEPSEIDIFMCKGECHYAQFTAHGHHQHVSNPASNHALFQGYLHTINKRLVPKLCCTPSKLDSVQVVHYDQDNPAQLTTTKWEGAIVKECACA